MADTTRDRRDDRRDEPRDLAPDLLGVKSRVSWGAILAGSVTALAVYFVFTLLFGALGITLTGTNMDRESIGTGVLIAMLLSIIVALFLGGWVSSQLTAGENRQEAVLYGLLTWATVTALAVFMAASVASAGAQAGYFAVVSGSVAGPDGARGAGWENSLKAIGVSDTRIAEIRASADPERLRQAAADPAERGRARDAAITASWTALVGTMLSMAAAIGGALVGCGTAFRLFPRAVVRTETPPRIIVPTA